MSFQSLCRRLSPPARAGQPRRARTAPRRLRPLAAALLLLGLGAAAQAQTLGELVEAARGFDANYLAARATAESVQYRYAQAESLRRPSAALLASGGRSWTDPPSSNTSSGESVSANTATLELQARQSLFNRANGATIDQTAKSVEAAAADLDAAGQDLILRVTQAYFDVLAAQDTVATTRTNKAAISEQLASAKRNFEVGTATITDTREAQARFDLASAQELQADNELRTRRIALDQLVGRTEVQPRGLAVPVALPAVMPAAVDDWVARADAEHPAVRKARLALDIARLETEKARAGHLPTLDATGSVGGRRNVSSLGTTRSATVGLQLNVPLFSGYSVQNRVKETLLLEEKSRNDVEAARRGVAQNTRVAFYGVNSLQAQVKALEAAESSSQLALEATQLGYKVGVRVNLDVLNAQTQLFSTRRDLAKARYDVLVNSLRLRQASGQLKPEDVGLVDALLQK